MRTLAIALLAGTCVAACSVADDVDVEARRSIGSTSPAPDVEGDPPAVPPVSPTTTTAPTESPDDSAEPVRFVLDDVIVEVSLRPTTADGTVGDVGFTGAVELDDGGFVASGFDGPDSEPSALWRSDDGGSWERVGSEVGAAPGRQEIRDLVLDDTTVTAFGVFLDSDPRRIESAGRWAAESDGDDWSTLRSLPSTSVNRAAVLDGLVLTVGADRLDEPGGFGGVVTFWLSGVPSEVVPTDVDDSGRPVPGSEVFDVGIDPVDGSWLAVGLTTITDSARTGDELASETDRDDVPTDVAIWRSDDVGRTWSAVPVGLFTDVPGAQRALDLLRVDDEWWLLTAERGIGTTCELGLYVSHDGIDWAPQTSRPPRPATDANAVWTAGLSLVDGIVVLVDEASTASVPSTAMTMIDPATGATDRHDLTDELGGVRSIGQVIELSDGTTGLGFGRIERAPGTSDLQVIEIRRSDDAPDPDDAPPTTAPPLGGGSSDA